MFLLNLFSIDFTGLNGTFNHCLELDILSLYV